MKWRLINSGFNSGEINMQFDVSLAESLPDGEAVLRLYRWKPFCISLGANQDKDIININKASDDGIDVVKRPTGGRAILHAEELTYSVVYPVSFQIPPKQLYSEINLAIKKGLVFYDSDFKDIQLENGQPHFPSFYTDQKSSICFAISARSELNYCEKKIVGSAQRKMKNNILQHGSILCGKKHLDIINYLNLSTDILLKLKQEIENSTTDIQSITGKKVDYEYFAEAIKTGFEEHFKIRFEINTNLKKNGFKIIG